MPLKFIELDLERCVSKPKSRKYGWYLCTAEGCGNVVSARVDSVNRGDTTSCGCSTKDLQSTHGLSNHRLFSIWLSIKQRCFNPNNTSYHNYGGRGITICKEWIEDFMNFYSWATDNGYKDHLTIDRKDNDGPYAPWNCTWSTYVEQALNRRTNKVYTAFGRTAPLSVLVEEFSQIDYKTVHARLDNGSWSIEDALTKPKNTILNRPKVRGPYKKKITT